jgi:hypothetical protein
MSESPLSVPTDELFSETKLSTLLEMFSILSETLIYVGRQQKSRFEAR